MMSTTKRHPGEMHARIAADADGRITAMEFTGDFNTGAYASWGPTVASRVPIHASVPINPALSGQGQSYSYKWPAIRGVSWFWCAAINYHSGSAL